MGGPADAESVAAVLQQHLLAGAAAQGFDARAAGTGIELAGHRISVVAELSELADAPRGLVRASIGFRLRAADLWAAPTVELVHAFGADRDAAVMAGVQQFTEEVLPAVVEAVSGTPDRCQVLTTEGSGELALPAGWRIVLGPLWYLTQHGGQTPCCPYCLFTLSAPSLRALFAEPRCTGVRIFAARNPDGTGNADCRANGVDLPAAAAAIAAGAAAWPNDGGGAYRRQYMLLLPPRPPLARRLLGSLGNVLRGKPRY